MRTLLSGIAALFLTTSCSGSNAAGTFVAQQDAGPDVAIAETTPAQEAAADAANTSGPPYPIVLAHGMGGFGTLHAGTLDLLTYFNGVKADLAAHGETQVFTTIVAPYDTSETRAKQLAQQIDQILSQTGKTKVNLIGHSQGGMDARVLASPHGLGYGDRLATVTLVATPNHGSRVADLIMNTGLVPNDSSISGQLADGIAQMLERAVYDFQCGGPLQPPCDTKLVAQVTELSEHYMETTFNPKYDDDPRVQYFSYAGRTDDLDGTPDCSTGLYPDDPTKVDDPQVFMKPLADYLQNGMHKPNDGLVTVQSARWGTFMQCVPADHMSEVGQVGQNGPDPKSGFDHLVFWRSIVQRVRDLGY